MLGASRQSLATLTAVVADRAAEGVDAGLAGQLYAVADLLGRDKPLRSALADSGTTAPARRALIDSLLTNRVSPPALDLATQAVALRWSDAADLVTAIESLAAQAAFARADAGATLDATEEELFRFSRAVDASSELQMALTDPSVVTAQKAAIVETLLADRTTDTTREVLAFTVSHLHGRRLDSAIEALMGLAAAQRQRMVAEVRVAAPLQPEQHQRLSAVLSEISGHEVRLNVAIDPTVLGGVHVALGDEIIDGTVAARLDQARRVVLGTA